jgi:hypothetical protein
MSPTEVRINRHFTILNWTLFATFCCSMAVLVLVAEL